ncbi:uncharacterized protein LOC144984160 [Oryzias latipes]
MTHMLDSKFKQYVMVACQTPPPPALLLIHLSCDYSSHQATCYKRRPSFIILHQSNNPDGSLLIPRESPEFTTSSSSSHSSPPLTHPATGVRHERYQNLQSRAAALITHDVIWKHQELKINIVLTSLLTCLCLLGFSIWVRSAF